MNEKELDLFVENIYRLKHKLFKSLVLLYLDYEAHVPDLMTRIRALPGFAVVCQSEKVERSQARGAPYTGVAQTNHPPHQDHTRPA